MTGSTFETLTITKNLAGNVISGNIISFSDVWRIEHNDEFNILEIQYNDGGVWKRTAVLAQL